MVTIALIVACAWGGVWQLTLGDDGFGRAVYAFGLVPAVLTGHATLPAQTALVFPPATLLTGALLHAGALHLLANVLFLWVFGTRVEDATGRLAYAGFLAFTAAAAGLAQTAADPYSVVPAIGAGGVVSGAIGAWLLLHPRPATRVAVPLAAGLPRLHVPAGALVAAWVALQIAGALLAAPDAPGVRWPAHAGGFVAGALLVPFLKRPHVRLLE